MSCGCTGTVRAEDRVFNVFPVSRSLTKVKAKTSPILRTSATVSAASSPRRAPVYRLRSGIQNAASPLPDFGRSFFVNTADRNSRLSSGMLNASRSDASSRRRILAKGSDHEILSGTIPLSCAHSPIVCTPPSSLLTVGALILCAPGCFRPHSASSGNGACNNFAERCRGTSSWRRES
jgi:hypothetical protein